MKLHFIDYYHLYLKEMYNLSFNNNYILGILDYLSYGTDYLGLNSEKYINAGVLLINLEKIRKDKKYIDMLYMYKTFKKLNNNDQTIIIWVENAKNTPFFDEIAKFYKIKR